MADNNEKFIHLANLEKLAQGLQSKFQNEMFEMLPCYDTREQGSINLTFDGNIQDKETVSVMDGIVNFVNLYKNVTIDDIYGLQDGTITITSATSEGNQDVTISIASIGGIQEYNEHIYLCNGGIFCVVLQDSFFEMYEITLTKGIWVVLLPVSGGTSYASALSYKKIISGELKIIDDKYLENKPGFKTENKTLYSIFSEQEYIGQSGAEIFNNSNIAVGMNSHAEGYMTEAIGPMTHTEGYMTSAEYDYSHAEGSGTIARGSAAHCEGKYAIANGNASHAEGYGTIASGDYQHAQGKYNIEDTENKYAHIVGNGTSSEKASNAHTLDWDGNAWFAGKVSAEGEPVDTNDLVNKEYVDNVILENKNYIDNVSLENKQYVDNVIEDNKLYYEEFATIKEYKNTDMILEEDSSEQGMYFKGYRFTSSIGIVPDNKYQMSLTIDNNKIDMFITTVQQNGAINIIVGLSYDPMIQVMIYDKMSASGEFDENCAVAEIMSMTDEIGDITNIEIKEQTTIEINNEFLETHRFITEEERTVWNTDDLYITKLEDNIISTVFEISQQEEQEGAYAVAGTLIPSSPINTNTKQLLKIELNNDNVFELILEPTNMGSTSVLMGTNNLMSVLIQFLGEACTFSIQSYNGYMIPSSIELQSIVDAQNINNEFYETHRFITEEERDNWNNKADKDILVNGTVENNVLNLTTDKYQKVEMVDGTEIVLPAVTDFTEIHLYFTALSDLTLIFPVGKYQKTPEIKANKTYEFIFTYIGEWLIGFIEYGN